MTDQHLYHCPVEATLDVIGGKWKPIIIHYLLQRTMRFSELKRAIPDVTQRMLTKHLRELEDSGVIHREVYPQVPPKVEYSITAFGRTLQPLLDAMLVWGLHYAEEHPEAFVDSLEKPAGLS